MDRLSNWLVRGCLILVLLLGTVACGANAPRSVVEDALHFEIAHAGDAANALVGVELLEQWSQVRSVKVQSQKSVDVYADGATYAGVDVRGTYTLAVRTPNRKSRYKRTEPFALTLAHLVVPETERDRWLLAQPLDVAANSTSSGWVLVDFLPEPEPDRTEPVDSAIPPEISPEETSDIVGAFETLGERDLIGDDAPADTSNSTNRPR